MTTFSTKRAIAANPTAVFAAFQNPAQLTITLQEHPAGKLLVWEQVFDDDTVANAIRHFVEPANEQNLDRLCAEVQSDALFAS